VHDFRRVSPVWLRPSAFGLVLCLHFVVLGGVPWPAGTDIVQPPPLEIQVIPQAEPAQLLVPLYSTPAAEIKPANAVPVDVQAVEAQPLHQGQEIAELKPSEPAFAINSPQRVLASPAPQAAELTPLAARPPTAPVDVAQPTPEAASSGASASPVDPALQGPLPSPGQPVAESQPLEVGPAAAVQAAQPAREAQNAAAASALPTDPPSRPLPSEQKVAEAEPVRVRPAAAVQTAQPAREAQSAAAASALPANPPSRPQPSEQQAAEAEPLGVRPAAPVQATQPAREAQSPAAASALSSDPPTRPQPSEQPVAEADPLRVRPGAPVQTAQPAREAQSVTAAPALPIDPPSRPLSSAQQVAELAPLGVRPAAAAQAVQPSREDQSAAASVLPIAPPSRPLSSAQQVAELAPLGVAPAPVGVGPPAHEVPMAGSSTMARDSPTPGTVLSSEQQVAKLEPYSPGAAPPLQGEGPITPGRIGQIVRYVEHYDGGRCFFVAPVAVTETEAKLEGYGASARPFEALDTAFRHENGFEATIDVRLVNPAQCPAVAFLGRLRGSSAPHLRVDAGNLGPGDVLSGTVDGFGSRKVELLIATDAGTVQNVSHLLKPGTDAKTFTISRRDIAWASGGQPQLLIVVASPRPLDALRFDRPIAAERLFSAVLGEAARTNQPLAAMARYFKIER
jgi:hypothetical protein